MPAVSSLVVIEVERCLFDSWWQEIFVKTEAEIEANYFFDDP
jgi:hypothetical protein